MITFLAIVGAIAATIVIAGVTVTALATIVRRLTQPAATTATATTELEPRLHPAGGGQWEYVCDCEGCTAAPQPDTTVTPGREFGHQIPRDTFCHDRSQDCACGPTLSWSVAGPYLMHRASTALSA